MEICRVIKATRNNFSILASDAKVYDAILSGKAVKKKAVRVGDLVEVALPGEESRPAVINAILPRKSTLTRGRGYKTHVIAANIDLVLIIISAVRPDFRHSLLDRYLLVAERNDLPAAVCLNKCDLAEMRKFDRIKEYYNRIGYRMIYTSAKTGEGVSELKKLLKNKITAVIGHSGVGKSSLIKVVQPGLDIHTREISAKSGKGKHTTTHTGLYPLDIGGGIIDTPGIKELGVGDILKKELKDYFVEFKNYGNECRFADCLHLKEPGCAVIEAVSKGHIPAERHLSYVQIYEDLPEYEYEWEQGKVPPV